MALAQQALMRIGPVNKVDVASALECVLVNRHQDRDVFREMFQAFFKDPELAHRLLAHTVPQSAAPKKNQPRPRALDALSSAARPPAEPAGLSLDLDAAMKSSQLAWLKQAAFNQLGATDYHMLEHRERQIHMPRP